MKEFKQNNEILPQKKVNEQMNDTNLDFSRTEKGEEVEYSVDKKIGDITYTIDLKGSKGNPVYRLSFDTKEYGQAITNQGLEVFNNVVDTISFLVNKARETDHITGLEFHSANESFSKDNLGKITEIIGTAYNNNPKVFDNFHYQDETQKLDIEDQTIRQQTRGKDFDDQGNIVWIESAVQEVSLSHLIQSKEEFVKNFYSNEEFADKLLRHIGYTLGMEPFKIKNNINKNTEIQRNNLYLRILKNKFPNLPVFLDEFGRIIVSFEAK